MEQELTARLPPSLAPEHDWDAASRVIHPSLRPVGTPGVSGHETTLPARRSPGEPIVTSGPVGLQVVFVIPASGFGVVVSGEHLLSWHVTPDQLGQAALANLATWSAKADWNEDVDGGRKVVWSDSGEGMDAARILLPEVRADLMADLSPLGRVLVGIPEQSLLIATCLAAGDEEFAPMFADYVRDRWSESDEPIDPRVFELVGGELVEFGPVTAEA